MEISIPKSVKSIDDSAFYGCISLTSIMIPEEVTRIESFAFGDCSNLISITLSSNVASVGELAFFGCSNLKRVEFCDAEGWYVTANSDDEEGVEIASANLSDPAKAAELLKDMYSGYYWKKH